MGGRRWMWLAAGLAGWAGAQTHKVAKPESVVRAVGVYEWTGDLAKPKGERLVPVTIFIDGHLEDAAVYLARPVPLALEQGTIYELDDAGVPRGLVDVKEARHVQIPQAADLAPYDDGWFGYGSFVAPPAPKPLAVKKPTQQVAVNGKVPAADPDRPSFSNRGARSGASDDAKPEPGSPEDVKVDAGKDDKDAVDVDRPTLRRRPPVDPKEAKKVRKERDQASVTGENKSLNDDPDRPRMKRGSGPGEDEVAVLNGLPADMKQMVAVSDAKTRETHPFARAWTDEAEHQAVLAKMRGVAQAALVAYGPVPPGTPVVVAGVAGMGSAGNAAGSTSGGAAGTALTAQDTSAGGPPVLRRNHVDPNAAAKEQVTAPAAASAPAVKPKAAAGSAAARRGNSTGRHAAAKNVPSQEMVLTGEDVKGFTLSYGGAPTYVYTARANGAGAGLRYVTVVAQDDGVNGLRMVLKTVTDAAHLDRQPWMRFVDVVDAQASNRASLLFEMRGQTSRQFALYRVLGAKADSLFVGGTTQ